MPNQETSNEFFPSISSWAQFNAKCIIKTRIFCKPHTLWIFRFLVKGVRNTESWIVDFMQIKYKTKKLKNPRALNFSLTLLLSVIYSDLYFVAKCWGNVKHKQHMEDEIFCRLNDVLVFCIVWNSNHQICLSLQMGYTGSRYLGGLQNLNICNRGRNIESHCNIQNLKEWINEINEWE